MSWKDLLGSHVHEKTRWQRVRWILALDEAAKLGRAATWDEWNKIWFRGEPYTPAAAKKALTRLCADLRELGVELRFSEGRFVDARGSSLRALIEPWLERARRLDEEIDARRRQKKRAELQEPEDDLGDDEVGEFVVLDPATVVAEYRHAAKSINEIGHLHRVVVDGSRRSSTRRAWSDSRTTSAASNRPDLRACSRRLSPPSTPERPGPRSRRSSAAEPEPRGGSSAGMGASETRAPAPQDRMCPAAD